MKQIIDTTIPKYIIIRWKGRQLQFFDGAKLYGRDSENILRVSKVKFSDSIHTINLGNLERYKAIYDGMKKYGEIDNDCLYEIAEIQTEIVVTDFISIPQ